MNDETKDDIQLVPPPDYKKLKSYWRYFTYNNACSSGNACF